MSQIKTYLEESYNELMHKVTWPTWNELQGSALVVAVAAIIISLLVWVMDVTIGITGTADSTWRGILGFFYDMVK